MSVTQELPVPLQLALDDGDEEIGVDRLSEVIINTG
jgi:hypothetical protein